MNDYKLKGRLNEKEYIDGILSRDTLILSKAITLIESSLEQDKKIAEAILDHLLPYAGKSIRIGITGVPGVGKSTFIESFGHHLIQQNKRVAVLTIDPTSQLSKGSILADKTRMPKLATHTNCFVRPSPAGQQLGGIAPKTREAILLCEAAGFDIIIVETVGIGQSETMVKNMIDFFLLLMLAGAGDEVQGIKKGVMEMADLIAINKADGDNIDAAEKAKAQLENVIQFFPTPNSQWKPKVITCSALENLGLVTIWQEILHYHRQTKKNGFFNNNRNQQKISWLHQGAKELLYNHFHSNKMIKKELKKMEQSVLKNEITPTKAIHKLINMYLSE